MGICYVYVPELAPRPEIRRLQQQSDWAQRQTKRERRQLSEAFVQAYRGHLAACDVDQIIARFGPTARVVCLFCVEGAPEACHRSLVAAWLAHWGGIEVSHVRL